MVRPTIVLCKRPVTSTVDYDGSFKNDHYWPNLQGAGQTRAKTSLNLQPIYVK